MNTVLFSFVLTIIAGLSTLLGYFVIFINKIEHNKIISCSLAFASGVMLSVSLIDLIPESLKLINFNNYFFTLLISFITIFIGIFISVILDIFTNRYNNNLLFKTGLLSLIAIIIHNIPEGIITFITTSNDINLGIKLTMAIAFHNIPEGISIAVPIYYASCDKKKAFTYTLMAALSEPLGAVITYLFLNKFINDLILGILFSLIAGIMLKLSLCNLLPTSKKYQYSKLIKYFFIFGILIMVISVYL